MKNSFLILLFSLSIIQCAAPQHTAEEKALIEKYQIPKFHNGKIQKFAFEYAAFFNDFTEATKYSNYAKIQELSEKSVEMINKASKYTKKLSPEDAQKWVEWTFKIAQADFPVH